MDLKEFSYLIALAEQGSISKAASSLYMSQSNLSQFLQQYEKELGVRLFVRSPKGIRPTHNGAIFIDHLKKLTEDYRRAKNELWDNEDLKGGVVTLGISSFRGRWVLPHILKRFYEKYPAVRVDIVEGSAERLDAQLAHSRLDLAILPFSFERSRKDARFLARDELLLAAAPDHPVLELASPKENGSGQWVELRDAARSRFILSGSSTVMGDTARKLFQKEKLDPDILYENMSADLALSLASEGMGLAFVYRSFARMCGHELAFLSIGQEGVFLDLCLVSPSGEYLSKAAQALEEVIREVFSSI